MIFIINHHQSILITIIINITLSSSIFIHDHRLSSIIITNSHHQSSFLTHWGWVTHICVSKLTNIGSDNGLSPGRSQAIIWTNAGILLFGPLGTNFSENLIGIQTSSFRKMPLKMSSAKWCPFSLGLNVLITTISHQSWSSAIYTFIDLLIFIQKTWCLLVLTNRHTVEHVGTARTTMFSPQTHLDQNHN